MTTGKQQRRINRESVTEQTFTDLKERILNGEFIAGEKLPSENMLSEEYGISRLSVRAALQKLKTLGLVDIRVGEGTFVQEMNFNNLMYEVSSFIAQESMIKHVFEFRQSIEMACVQQALSRATSKDIEQLISIAQNMYTVASNDDIEGYIESDYAFHYQLCKMSHNPLYELVYSSIKDLFKLTIRKNVSETKELYGKGLVECAKYHIQIADAFSIHNEKKVIELLDKIIEIKPGRDI